MSGYATLDWLGCATFRLSVDGLVVFLDAYVDRARHAPDRPGRGNIDGEPIQGSLVEFIAGEVALLQPRRLILGHHDDWLPGFSIPTNTGPICAAVAAVARDVDLVEVGYRAAYPLFARAGGRPVVRNGHRSRLIVGREPGAITEADAHPTYVEQFIAASAEDTLYTVCSACASRQPRLVEDDVVGQNR